jgi:hypothetical protein
MSVPVSCAGMVNPANASHPFSPKSAVVEGRTLELRAGDINGVQYAWARLTNPDDGDSIWLEISGDSGVTWIQCGRRTIHTSGRNYTDAQRTNSSPEVCMRAALQLGPQYQTGDWCE